MSRQNARNTKSRTRTIENLEQRQVMSADPVAQLLGGAAQPQSALTAPAVVQHGNVDYDFWIDPEVERALNLEALTGGLNQLLTNANSLTGLSQVRANYGFSGSGQTVAVIDSGIAWDHIALGGGFGKDYRVVGGWDFTEENDANPYDDGPAGSHGTHVSGIIGGDRTGTADDGVAPGVDLVGLRVFNDVGQGNFSWVEKALQWVHENRNKFENPITAINLSLGTSWNATTIPTWTTLEDEFAQLKADGIFIAVSAGNSFGTYKTAGLSYPAASPNVVPVMSVDDTGSLSSFSQRQSRAIAAPGRNIVSSVPDYLGNNNGKADDFATFSGTSMAAPYIAGASVLIREAMQFVGTSNITQDTIYNHMMKTATSIFDTATKQSYKMINLGAAIDALMPTDDFGSTAATAFNLGSLSGKSAKSGVVSKTSDVDYFKFTAGSSGTVTFTATTHDDMQATWSGTGGTVSGAHGETYTFQVVAGQTYAVGIGTSDGVGHYDLAINSVSDEKFTDWGAVTQMQKTDVANSGTTWYRIKATQTGYLTAEALFATAGGNIDIAVYGTNQKLLATGTTRPTGKRVDVMVSAGQEYLLKVSGTNADIDFRITNLLSRTGTTLNFAGTSAADTFGFKIDPTQYTLCVNGTTYTFAKTLMSQITFNGGDGDDSISMTGSAAAESAVLKIGGVTFKGAGVTANAVGVENVTVNGGGGNDSAQLFDSAGNDQLLMGYKFATLTGTNYSHAVNAFSNISATASTGDDVAMLLDSAGNDTYRAYSDRAEMKGAGYTNTATGFDTTNATATTGTDTAYFYDSAGDDVFTASPTSAKMSGAGYVNTADTFDVACGYASTGNDSAYLYDSAGNDSYRSYSDRATMAGTGYSNTAYTFDSTIGRSSKGNDTATMYDSRGDDVYVIDADRAQMSGADFRNTAVGFKRNIAYASTGLDSAYIDDVRPSDAAKGSAWDLFSPTAAKADAHGFDAFVTASLASKETGVNLDAIDALFSQLKDVSERASTARPPARPQI
jgi:subtilisin family serine protease